MSSTPMTSATESISRGSTSRLPTSTPSSPPTDVSHHGDRMDESEELADGVSKSMLEEEKKLQTAVLKEEMERAAALQAEREKDAAGGEDVIDPKFKRLEFLLQQSSIYSNILMSKMEQQRENAQATDERAQRAIKKEGESKPSSAPSSTTQMRKSTRSAQTATQAVVEDQGKGGKRTTALGKAGKSSVKKTPSEVNLASYFRKDELSARAKNLSVSEALEEAAEKEDAALSKLGAQDLRSARQPDLVTGGIMRSYQLEGLEWLISLYENGLNGILADEMGLGKTIQTISFLAFLRSKGTFGPFLVVAPLSTLSNWIDEFAKWTPDMPTVLYHGSIAEREEIRDTRMRKKRGAVDFPIVCTSYEICMNDRKHLATMGWKFIIIDEGHRLKNLNCRLMRELKSYESANRLLITGTPLQNNLAELWSLLNFLMPDIFDQLESFESWFDFSALQQKGGHEQILIGERKNHVISSLHAILKPFLLRRVKADVESSLPKKREYILYAPLTTTQKELYRQILEGNSRTYLQEKVVARLNDLAESKRKPTRSASLNLKKRKAEAAPAPATPHKASKTGRTATPHSESRGRRTLRRQNYAEPSERDDFTSPPSPEVIELDSEDEVQAERAANLVIAKREISHKKLQNPIMQLRLACNSPHNFYWPFLPSTNVPPNATLISESGKMRLLDRLVPALFAAGHKVLIFSQFKTQLDIIEDWATLLHDWQICRIDGGVKQEDRRAQIHAFNTDKAYRLFLLSTRAGGQGINLAAADTVILFDSDWNPQQDLQAQDRAHRIGQTRPVIVYRLATKGTVEQTLLEKADGKRRLEKLVIQKGKFRNLLDVKKTSETSAVDELQRILTEDDFEQYEMDEQGELLSAAELHVLMDRSEEAYRRAAKGLDGGDAFKVVETKADEGGVLTEMAR